MRAFLTGATGIVGRQVFRALSARGALVRVGARAPSTASDLLGAGVDVVQLDFDDPELAPDTFAGVEALFFMTPLVDDQVASSRRVLSAAIDAGVSHVVRLSSRSAGWDRKSELRAWHRAIEDDVRNSGANWTILRPCSFFQNFITYQAAAIRRMSSIIVPQGDGLIPYIDALDLGEAAAECMFRPEAHAGVTHVLTGARAYGVKGVAAEIGRVIGKPLTYINVDEAQTRDSMKQMGTPPWLIEAGLAVFAHARAGGEAAVDPALTKILARPATSLSEFAERNREAWL